MAEQAWFARYGDQLLSEEEIFLDDDTPDEEEVVQPTERKRERKRDDAGRQKRRARVDPGFATKGMESLDAYQFYLGERPKHPSETVKWAKQVPMPEAWIGEGVDARAAAALIGLATWYVPQCIGGALEFPKTVNRTTLVE